MPRRSLTAKELLAFCEKKNSCIRSREWIASEISSAAIGPLSAEDLWNRCERGPWLQWLIYCTGDEMGSSWIEGWVACRTRHATDTGDGNYDLKPMAVDIRNNFAFWPIESRISKEMGINLYEEEKKEVQAVAETDASTV